MCLSYRNAGREGEVSYAVYFGSTGCSHYKPKMPFYRMGTLLDLIVHGFNCSPYHMSPFPLSFSFTFSLWRLVPAKEWVLTPRKRRKKTKKRRRRTKKKRKLERVNRVSLLDKCPDPPSPLQSLTFLFIVFNTCFIIEIIHIQ